jgi:hypothetical protein
MKRKRLLFALASLAAAVLLSTLSGAVTGVNPLTSKRDNVNSAWWDTTFTTAAGPSDVYCNWGFSATTVTISTMTTGQSALCQIYGKQTALLNQGGSSGSVSNPRAGMPAVDGEELTIPALATFPYNADGAAIFYGLRVKYTGGACTVIVTAARKGN